MPPARLCLSFLFALGLLFASQADARQVLRRAPDSFYQSALEAMESGDKGAVRMALDRGGDPVLNKVLKAYLMAQPGNDFSFDEMASFITENPDWPGLKGILMIAEQKIPQGASAAQIVNWFNAYPPLTAAGFYRHMEALNEAGQSRIAESLIRNYWIEKDLSKSEGEAFRSRYGRFLNSKDHFARLDRLLWDGNTSAAKAMYPLVGEGVRALAEARLALACQSKKAEALLKKVPASLQRDPGLLYERLRWRRQKGTDKSAIEILLNAPENLVRPEKWWKESHVVIRRLMEEKNYSLAYKLAARHGNYDGFSFAQAEFLAGWLALRFLNKPALAERHFKNLIESTKSPLSQSRGYYWLGRTYEATGRKREAEQTYESAATFDTTFYGQLAITRLYSNPTIHASTEPAIPPAVRDRFFSRDLIRAVQKLNDMGFVSLANTYFKAATDFASQRVEFALLLELAYELQRADLAVNVAKAANQKNFLLKGGAYPLLAMQLPSEPEVALTHALIRQESQFQPDAGSPVGARGLMQLMPATAKGVAKKLGVSYAPHRLTDPDYNILLGTRFIQDQIDNFDGSYVLALAGYNAGPGRARQWIETFGDPRSPNVDAVDWIEMIPIYETRNYIQRIIENLQFYRARLAQSPVPLTIAQDLKR